MKEGGEPEPGKGGQVSEGEAGKSISPLFLPPPSPRVPGKIKTYKLKLVQQACTPPLSPPTPPRNTREGTQKQRGRLRGCSHQPRRVSPAWPGRRVSRARQPRNAKGGGFSWLPSLVPLSSNHAQPPPSPPASLGQGTSTTCLQPPPPPLCGLVWRAQDLGDRLPPDLQGTGSK